jgi:quercetin dioxygenase-like cupin family protein
VADTDAFALTGQWGHNPVTGELAHVTVGPEQTDGRRIEVELWLQPGAAVANAHSHDTLIERFTVLEGSVSFLLDGRERTVAPGDGTAEVAVGVVHDWWNRGDGIARVLVEVEAAPHVPGPTAGRFVAMIETLWSLGALGKVNAKGMPDALWLAAIAREYRDAIRFAKPPAILQTLLFAPLAALARRSGRDPAAPELHGSHAPIWIADPGDDLTQLLQQRVTAAGAHGHS